MADPDIVIAGGGIAGLALALALADSGKTVALCEPRPPQSLTKTKPTGRSLALTRRSVEILGQTGVWADLDGLCEPIQGFCLIDDSRPSKGPVRADFPASRIGIESFGLNVPNTVLRAALWERAAARPGITIHESAASGQVAEAEQVRVTLEDGTALSAGLLVGADGRGSPVRERAGLRACRRPVGQSALTCRISHSVAHNGMATEFHRPGGLLALVPLPGDTSAVVWMDAPEALPAGEALAPALQAATNGVLGDVEIQDAPEVWPLERLYVPRVTAARTALVAEAAHGFPPTGAQGLNLSLRDVAVLARLAGQADDPGAVSVLRRYGRKRALDTASCIAGVMGMNSAIRSRALPVRLARRTLLRGAGASVLLQRVVVHGGQAFQALSGGLRVRRSAA